MTKSICVGVQEFLVPPVPEVVSDASAAGQLALRTKRQTHSAPVEGTAEEQSWQALPFAETLGELRPGQTASQQLTVNTDQSLASAVLPGADVLLEVWASA